METGPAPKVGLTPMDVTAVKDYFTGLQDAIVVALEALDGGAFRRDAWTRAEGGGGSSQTPTRAIVLDEPPSVDAGEITDKGYVNQRAVLERRASDVIALYSDIPDPRVVRI